MVVGLVFVSRDFEFGTNVSCEESTVSPRTGLMFGVVRPIEKHWETDVVTLWCTPKKTAEPIEMPFEADSWAQGTICGSRSDESIRGREG